MRYRIKIVTYKSGRKTFSPQFKKFFGWANIGYEGTTSYSYDVEFNRREYALLRIDDHYNGSNVKQTIEFEYINK